MRGRLHFTIGLPRSGKSTYCREWVDARRHGDPPRAIVSGDEFRLALTGQAYVPLAEGVVFAAMDLATRPPCSPAASMWS